MADSTPGKPLGASTPTPVGAQNVKFQTTITNAPLKKSALPESVKLSARTLAEQSAGRDVLKERGAVK